MADWSKGIWNLALQTLKISHLHYHNACDNQPWKGNVLSWRAPANENTWSFDHVVLRDNMAEYSYFNSTTRVVIATKLGRMVVHLDGLVPIKPYDHLITWSCKITRHTKIIISPLPQYLWTPNLIRWGHTMRGS